MGELAYSRAGQVQWRIKPSIVNPGSLVVYVMGGRVGYAADLSTALMMVRHHRGLS